MDRAVGPGRLWTELWDLGRPYLNGAVTPVHLVIYQLDAVLHALWGQELSLAHHSWMERGDRTVRVPRGRSWWSLPTLWSSLTVHGSWGSSAHASVLNLVHGLCGSLPLLLSFGWCRGCRGRWGSTFRGGSPCSSHRPLPFLTWLHEHNGFLQRGWGWRCSWRCTRWRLL